jgi:prefoldin subunit 5
MGEKISSNEVLEIISDYKNKSNKDLKIALEFLNKDFEVTKETLLKLTNHLDKVENTYNLLLKEFTQRNGNK